MIDQYEAGPIQNEEQARTFNWIEEPDMRNDKRSPSMATSFIRTLTTGVAALVLTGVFVLAGCDSSGASAAENEISRVVIAPDSAAIPVGESVDFTFAALDARGDTVRDADLDITWWSTNTAVFTVEDDGLATGQEVGTARCMVEATEGVAGKTTLRFTGRDSAFVRVF